jgi:putative peptide maturation dehydrogenase
LGLLVADIDSYAPVRARDELLREAHWFAPAAVTHYFGRWQGVASGEAARQAGYSTMSELAEKLGAPPPHVRERVAPELRRALPTAQAGPFDELLRQRVTCRNFDTNEQVPLVAFAQMLHRVFGAQAVHEIQTDNIVIKRSSPSGGGLHPTEAYLLVQGVQDVAPGLYHYHAVDHALEPLPLPPGVQLAEFAARMVARQAYFADAPVLVVLASRFPRSFWKYRDHAKAYRVSVLDVGHLSQTLYLSATDLGLGAFITAAINERDIEEAFGLDPLLESPLAVCGFGLRSSTYTHVEFDPLHAIWPKPTV